MVDTPIPNQINYADGQNFELDIDKIYSDFMLAIDKLRSCNNANNIRDTSVLVALKDATQMADAKSALRSLCNLSISAQESRCHTFFRIIGFPCVDSSKSKIFNPGLDIGITDPSREVNNAYKISVIKDPIDKFRDLSVFRENYVSNVLNIFSVTNSIDAATLALSSGRNIRQFGASLIDSTYDDMDVISQQYKMDLTSSVGGTPKDLTEYEDIEGKKPEKLYNFTFTHIIKPFFVDPVIDLTVNDASKLIAVPFVNDKNHLKISDEKYVSRPILEQVIRDRFTINQKTSVGSADQSVLDYIKSIPNITDINIINNAVNLYKLNDQIQFVKFLNIIRAMIKKLVQAQHDIRTAQDNYYWLPIPSTIGPEGGCTVRGVFLSKSIGSDFITDKDKAIIEATINKLISDVDSKAANATATPDVGGYALPNSLGLPNLGGSTTPESLGDIINKNLKDLTTKRDNELKKANNALRTVEIIMGEFSGLGLCDIVAILGGLYLMPKESLLGFLDKDALSRMNKAGLTGAESNIITASTDFINVVKDFYNLMDKIYQDMSQNNGDT